MSSNIRFGISIPQAYPKGGIDPARIKRFVARAEALGFDGLWTQDNTLGHMPTLDSLELMTYAAAVTERIRLGCAVFISSQREPAHFAKGLTALDILSGGRLIVGVGIGRPDGDAVFGVDTKTRLARFNEGLQVMKLLWTEEKATLAGQFWQLEDTTMEPKPVQKPYPPIWFGAHHPAALKRAVTHGDGFIGAGSSTTEDFANDVVTLRGFLSEAGRDPASFPLSKRIYMGLSNSREEGLKGLQEWFQFNYGRPDRAERVSVWGTPADCIEGVRKVVDAGAEMVVFTPLFNEEDQMEHLAAEVMPHFA